MPPPRPQSSGETVRLANVFVRLPSDNHQRGGKRVAVLEGWKGGVSETASASQQHKPSPTSNEPPLTPHKTQKTTSPPTAAPPSTHLPPTPDQTPTKPALKRSFQSDPQTPSSSPLKRHRPNNTTAPLSPTPTPTSTSTPSPSPHRHHRRFNLTPKFSIVYQPHQLEQPTPPPLLGEQESKRKNKNKNEKEGAINISWLELKRVAESVMKQVDWEEVGEDVASNRSAGVYKRAVKDVLQERIEELVGGTGVE